MKNHPKSVRVLVSCRDASGTPTFHGVRVTVTPAQYANGEHYDLARGKAEEARYSNVGLCYDEDDLIARIFSHLWQQYGEREG